MSSLVKFLLLLTVFISTVSAFQCHVRSTPKGSSVMQRLPLPPPQNKITSILFAADDASENSATTSGEGSGEGATTATPSTYGALSGESTLKVVKKCPDCDLCDGSGRILGGIGTVLDWWPIKASNAHRSGRPFPRRVALFPRERLVRSPSGAPEIRTSASTARPSSSARKASFPTV